MYCAEETHTPKSSQSHAIFRSTEAKDELSEEMEEGSGSESEEEKDRVRRDNGRRDSRRGREWRTGKQKYLRGGKTERGE